MILYSIIPPEMVFRGYSYEEYAEPEKLYEAYYNGERIIVAQKSDNSYEIRRLLSTNPRSFLNPAFMPGNTVDASLLRMVGQ